MPDLAGINILTGAGARQTFSAGPSAIALLLLGSSPDSLSAARVLERHAQMYGISQDADSTLMNLLAASDPEGPQGLDRRRLWSGSVLQWQPAGWVPGRNQLQSWRSHVF
jgi:hypothetical protein